MAVVNHQAVLNPVPVSRTQATVVPTTIAAKDTLRIAVPVQGTTTSHFSNAALAFNNINLSLATKSGVNNVYVFITNTSNASINLPSGTLSVATFT
mgnify:CR=1 FL=1